MEYQKRVEATGDFIGSKIANKIRGVQRIHNKTIQKQLQMSMINKYLKIYIFSEEKQKIIYDLRLI